MTLRHALRVALLAGFALLALPARSDDRATLARRTCAALDRAVASQTGGPLLLASYRPWEGEPPDSAALRNVAFTYDNALASIALFACGRPRSARRIADALMAAIASDPEYRDGRVRNAYAAGSIEGQATKLPGYWDSRRNAWNQDAYQVSFATGNAAWAALALIEAYRRTRHAPYLDAARRVLDWIAANAGSDERPAGFVGGWFVGPSGLIRQGWKSTEQNVDLAAAWTALDRLHPAADATAKAAIAIAFVGSQWDRKEGRFFIGTGPDGRTSDHDHSGLDAQVWPLIALPDPPAEWTRVLSFVDAVHAVDGGYGYNRGPDGIWTEGTAQMASVFVLRGSPRRAAPLWPLLLQQQTSEGWLLATPKNRIRTGLAIGPDAVTDDFRYYRVPHLGATAWAAIAALGVNPFKGR